MFKMRDEPPVIQFAESDTVKSVLEKHGFTEHEATKTKTQSTHGKNSAHIVQHGEDGSWEHHNVLKPRSEQGRGKGAKSLATHLAKYTSDLTKNASQHSELSAPLSFAPAYVGSVAPAIQFREEDDNVPGNVQLSKHHQTLKKKGYKFKATGNNGWTAHYEHPRTGATARIEWKGGADTHGSLKENS